MNLELNQYIFYFFRSYKQTEAHEFISRLKEYDGFNGWQHHVEGEDEVILASRDDDILPMYMLVTSCPKETIVYVFSDYTSAYDAYLYFKEGKPPEVGETIEIEEDEGEDVIADIRRVKDVRS